jgi:hypothetical protein
MELSEQQVEQVLIHLRSKGIAMPSLEEDLLDHLCCMIEARNEQRSFEEVFHEVMLEFSAEELNRVQKETNRLITLLKFKTMNTTLRISGLVSAISILTGSIFKILHWPGANILFVIGMFLMAVLFLPLFFALRYKQAENENKHLLLSIAGAVVGVLTALGIWFKMMHWPGASVMLYSSIAILLLGYLPVYIFAVYRKSLNKVNVFSNVILIIAVGSTLLLTTGVAGSTTSKKVSESIVRLLRDQEASVQQQLKMNDELLKRDSAASRFSLLHNETLSLVKMIDELKQRILFHSEDAVQYEEVYNWASRGGVIDIMGAEGEFSFSGLQKRLDAYAKISNNPSFLGNEAFLFVDQPLNIEIQRLTQLQMKVLLTEQALLMD